MAISPNEVEKSLKSPFDTFQISRAFLKNILQTEVENTDNIHANIENILVSDEFFKKLYYFFPESF